MRGEYIAICHSDCVSDSKQYELAIFFAICVPIHELFEQSNIQ